jgi:hypothetical protein
MINNENLYPTIPLNESEKLKSIPVTNSDLGHKDRASIVIPLFIPGTEATLVFRQTPFYAYVGANRCRFFETLQEAWQEACYEAGLESGLSYSKATFHEAQIIERAKEFIGSIDW